MKTRDGSLGCVLSLDHCMSHGRPVRSRRALTYSPKRMNISAAGYRHGDASLIAISDHNDDVQTYLADGSQHPAIQTGEGKECSLCFLTLQELAARVRSRDISPVEIVRDHLTRCESLNPKLNAFITLSAEQALNDAQTAEKEISAGRWRGALHGIPVGIKDCIDTAGIRTTIGSSFHRDRVPQADAGAIERLKAAGGIVLGKTNMHEFAAGSTTNNPWYGACHNPWDLDRSPGGSSGGSGASVAAFMCAGSLGSDTGGSIRAPAACNGIVGLKPTYGRVSLRGVFPNSWSLDTVGPLARSVHDAALILQGIAGYDIQDPTSVDVLVPDYTATIGAGVRGMRIAFCPDLHVSEVDDAVALALERAGDVLARLGAVLKTVSYSAKDIVYETCFGVHRSEFAEVHRERVRRNPEGYGADVRAIVERYASEPIGAYVRASQDRTILRRAFQEMMRDVDAILIPTAPCVAPYLRDGMSVVNGKSVVFGDVGVAMRIPVNVLGVPSVAVPIGFSGHLPISMQVVGKPWQEATILQIAHAYETATPELRGKRPSHA